MTRVVAEAFQPGLAGQQGIDPVSPALQDSGPGQVRETVRKLLCLVGIVELDEGIVVLLEAEFLGEHPLGQPFVTVDVDLDGEREERLQTDVHESELGIKEVIVEHALLAFGVIQVRAILALGQLDGAAGFLEAKDGNQPFADGMFVEHLADKVFLAAASLEVLVRDTGCNRRGLGVVDERLGQRLDHRQEVLAADAEDAIDEAVEVGVVTKGEIAFENHSIKATEDAYNGISELLREVGFRRHGVLLQSGWMLVCEHPLDSRTPCF